MVRACRPRWHSARHHHKLSSLCEKALREPSVLEKLALLGAETVALGPDAAREQMQREVKSFTQLATAMGIQPE